LTKHLPPSLVRLPRASIVLASSVLNTIHRVQKWFPIAVCLEVRPKERCLWVVNQPLLGSQPHLLHISRYVFPPSFTQIPTALWQYTPRSSSIRIAIAIPTPPTCLRTRILPWVLDLLAGFISMFDPCLEFPPCIQPTCTALQSTHFRHSPFHKILHHLPQKLHNTLLSIFVLADKTTS